MADNIIFLDIDGVLNTKESWKIPFSLDKNCIKNFCAFINYCKKDPKIVLTSSWKTGFSSLPEYETPQLQSLRKELAIYNVSLFGRTKDFGNRIAEINDYLQNHKVESYAVIDDDPDEYTRKYLKKVSLINADTGFTEKDGMKIKWNRIRLNKQKNKKKLFWRIFS